MSRWNDPTAVVGAECPCCLNYKHDTELDFAPSGDCWNCEDEKSNDEEDSDEDAVTLKTDWFDVAKSLVLQNNARHMIMNEETQ